MCTHWVWGRIGSGLRVRNSLLEFGPIGLWLSRLEVAHVWLACRVPKANLLEELKARALGCQDTPREVIASRFQYIQAVPNSPLNNVPLKMVWLR